jgi:hypothetical protein
MQAMSSPPSGNPPSGERSLKELLQALKWMLAVLLTLELVIRVFIFRVPFQEYGPVWGLVPRENSCSVQGVEGFSVTCYFENGEVVTPYRDGISVVVMGDSYTLGAQVNDSEKYVYLTERALRERGLKADLHNLGRSARSVADHIYLAPAVVNEYSPEIVVVQANSVNFLMSFDCDRENCFKKQPDGGFALLHRNLSPDITLQNMVYSSGLLAYASYRFMNIENNVNAEHLIALAAAKNAEIGMASEDEQVLYQVRALQAAFRNSTLVFIVIPDIPKISPSTLSPISWSSPNDEHLVSLLRGMGMYVVFPKKAFRQLYDQERLLPRGFINSMPNFGHMNEYGHAAVAEDLTVALEELLK